jgi:hypothetical protein
LRHFEIGQMDLRGICTGPERDGNVVDVPGLQFAGQAKEVLPAVEVAACNQDAAGIASGEFVEVGNRVAAGADGRNTLPAQQGKQRNPRKPTPTSLHVPEVSRSLACDDGEQREDCENVANSCVVTDWHGDDQHAERG